MNNKFYKSVLFTFIAFLSLSIFSSCEEDDVYYDYDYNLTGYWMLVEDDYGYVPEDETNFLYFNGNGFGSYFYYDRGRLYEMRLNYWCMANPYPGQDDELNIEYEDGTGATMNYWFERNYNFLTLSWYTDRGRETYVYQRVNGIY